jgi:phosphate/sulfate permease
VILTVAAGICVALVLGNGDAANAAAALIATKAASRPAAVAWSIGWHLIGGLLGGTAVAAAVAALVRVPPDRLPGVLLAGSLASIGFCRLAVRRGVPVSASRALFAGLAGAALVVGGIRATPLLSTRRLIDQASKLIDQRVPRREGRSSLVIGVGQTGSWIMRTAHPVHGAAFSS